MIHIRNLTFSSPMFSMAFEAMALGLVKTDFRTHPPDAAERMALPAGGLSDSLPGLVTGVAGCEPTMNFPQRTRLGRFFRIKQGDSSPYGKQQDKP